VPVKGNCIESGPGSVAEILLWFLLRRHKKGMKSLISQYCMIKCILKRSWWGAPIQLTMWGWYNQIIGRISPHFPLGSAPLR